MKKMDIKIKLVRHSLVRPDSLKIKNLGQVCNHKICVINSLETQHIIIIEYNIMCHIFMKTVGAIIFSLW